LKKRRIINNDSLKCFLYSLSDIPKQKCKCTAKQSLKLLQLFHVKFPATEYNGEKQINNYNYKCYVMPC